jgi:hypothetical protein
MWGYWGVSSGNGSCKVDEKRLAPLGLTCWGGPTDAFTGKQLYHVYNEDKSFDRNLNEEDFKNIDLIYKKFSRKYKLKKICNN